MEKERLQIMHISPDHLRRNNSAQESLAYFIAAGYEGIQLHEIEPGKFNLEKNIEGLLDGHHILAGWQSGEVTALLSYGFYTEQNHPEFFSSIERELSRLTPEMGSHVRKILGDLKGYFFTHEMVRNAKGIYKGHVTHLRDEALARIATELGENSRIALVGEFQRPQAIKLQLGIPQSHTYFAGDHIYQNNEPQMGYQEEQAYQQAARVVSRAYLNVYSPNAEYFSDDTVRSDLFMEKPFMPRDGENEYLRGAFRRVLARQEMFPEDSISAMGVTFCKLET